MAIVVGLDVHRAQITYDALNTATGEVVTGRIAPADRATLRRFLRRWTGEQVEAAVEATTGWRFVAEARDLLGGNGVLLENHVIRHMGDIEVIHTYEGTETMQTLIVGRDITGVGAFA